MNSQSWNSELTQNFTQLKQDFLLLVFSPKQMKHSDLIQFVKIRNSGFEIRKTIWWAAQWLCILPKKAKLSKKTKTWQFNAIFEIQRHCRSLCTSNVTALGRGVLLLQPPSWAGDSQSQDTWRRKNGPQSDSYLPQN